MMCHHGFAQVTTVYKIMLILYMCADKGCHGWKQFWAVHAPTWLQRNVSPLWMLKCWLAALDSVEVYMAASISILLSTALVIALSYAV